MKKMLVVASLLGSMMLANPQFVTPVRAQALGELCWSIEPVTNPLFGDLSRLRIAITASGTTWLLSGRWNYFRGGDLGPGFWTTSVAVSGAMARHLFTDTLDMSLVGYDYTDDPFSDFRFHAKIDTTTGNGTWKMPNGNGFLSGTLTVVPLSSCP